MYRESVIVPCLCLLCLFGAQMSGRVSRTNSAVRTTAACLAAGNVTTTTIVGTTPMKTSVVGSLCLFYSHDRSSLSYTETIIHNVIYELYCKQIVQIVVSNVSPLTACLSVIFT